MNKKSFAVLTTTAVAASLLLSGCQLLTGYQQIDTAENADAWAGKINPIAGEVNIACAGTYHCEITQIDQTMVIAPNSHKPANPAMIAQIENSADKSNTKLNKSMQAQAKNTQIKTDMTPLLTQKSIKIVPLSASGMKDLTNYYVRVKPAKREIHVNFYPENNLGYVEHFAIIHDFMQPGIYQLKAYRKKSTQEGGSLLESASPSSLCVDLLQGNTVKRHFCKQADAEHQGEFVETSMSNKTVIKVKAKS